MNTFRNRIVIVLTVLAVSCGIGRFSSAKEPQDKNNLVGVWSSTDAALSFIILRKSDGAFVEKVIQEYDNRKPQIHYVARGRWRINGNQYSTTTDYISTPIWKKDVGKTWKMEILAIGNNRFKYISTDGVTVVEKRIGGDSEVEFDNAVLKPLKK